MLDGVLVLVSCQQWHDGWGVCNASVQAADLHEVLWGTMLPSTTYVLFWKCKY